MTNYPLNSSFPPLEHALSEPNGLLAAGGDLSPERLLDAYSQGIFPWFNEDEPILWWSPDPRMVLFPNELKISPSMRKTLRKKNYQIYSPGEGAAAEEEEAENRSRNNASSSYSWSVNSSPHVH